MASLWKPPPVRFVKLTAPRARRVLLAHPKKLRIIAESKPRSDKLDAQVLAEFLADDAIPLAYQPTPRAVDDRNLLPHPEYGLPRRRRSSWKPCRGPTY